MSGLLREYAHSRQKAASPPFLPPLSRHNALQPVRPEHAPLPTSQASTLNVLTLVMAIDLAEAVEFADLMRASGEHAREHGARQTLATAETLLRELHAALTGNSTSLLSAQRVQADSLLPALLELARRLDASQPQQALFAMMLAQALASSLLHQAKRGLQQEAGHSGFFSSNKSKIDACADCLACAIEVLRTHALGYSSLPPGFWQDCHRLYRYLLDGGWESKTAAGKNDTLGALYRQLLLLGVAASNRLDPARIECLVQLVREGGKHAQLLPLASTVDGNGFIVNLERDAAPRHSSIRSKPGQEHAQLLLGVHRVLQCWEEKNQATPQLDAAAQLEQQLILKLRQELVYPPQRRYLRLHSKSEEFVQLHATLDHCWQALQAASDDAPPPVAYMQVCNMSSSGYLLRGQLPTMPLRSGELVLIRRTGRDPFLGVVRWINRHSPCGDTECGIEIVGKNPEAIQVKPVVTYATEQAQNAIRLAANARLNPQDVLVMYGKPYQALRQFEIHQPQGVLPVKATRLLLQTAYYQLINVRAERH